MRFQLDPFSNGKPREQTKTLAVLGLLTAVEIVLSRFCSINAWNIKIGFSFVPVALAGMLTGPLAAGAMAAVADFLGAVLFPVGPYFPGFTLTAFLTGVVFGLFLRKRQSSLRILGAVVTGQLLLSLLLNTLWISILYGSSFSALLATRLAQCVFMAPVQFLTLTALVRVRDRCTGRAAA